MPPKFVNNQHISKEETEEYLSFYKNLEYDDVTEKYSRFFHDMLTEIFYINYTFNFHTPQIKAHIITMSTFGELNKDLDSFQILNSSKSNPHTKRLSLKMSIKSQNILNDE